jgi:hypothetical protein
MPDTKKIDHFIHEVVYYENGHRFYGTCYFSEPFLIAADLNRLRRLSLALHEPRVLPMNIC